MVNLTSFQNYSTLFNSLKQLPQLSTPGLSNIAGAYMAAKYSSSMNKVLSSNLSSTITSFRNDATALSKQAKALTAQADRVGLKTDDNAVTGTTSQQLKTGATIKIDQLATKQTNQSSLFDAKQNTTIASGTRSLTIGSGNKSFTVSIAVQAGEKNGSILSKTAQGINDLGAGFKARVATDTLGNQQLVVEAEKTGEQNGFSISGELGTALNLNQVAQAGADAKFTYNGKDYQTSSNSVILDSGKTTLELKNITAQTVTLNQSADTTGLQERVTTLAEAYNQFQDTLKANPDNKALQAVSRQMEQLVTKNGSALEEFGITKNAQGKLIIDADQLKQGIADNPEEARALFVEKGSFTEKLQSKTEQLLKTPANGLIDLPKTPSSMSSSQLMNSSFVSQFTSTTQSSGYLFDMFL